MLGHFIFLCSPAYILQGNVNSNKIATNFLVEKIRGGYSVEIPGK
jgi:hypothetical protein